MIRLCVNLAATYAPTTHGAILPPLLSLSASQLRFTWQGREYSFATGLYNFRARWYDPAAGRWLSKDPIGLEGGLNLYEAFGNNPVCCVDPRGLAYFAYRALDLPVLKKFGPIYTTEDEIYNTVIGHEQLFFEDENSIPGNLGFFSDNKVKPDPARGIPYRTPHSTGWDDKIMREAVRQVRPHKYKLMGENQYNCQDWAEEVRKAYYEIKENGHYSPISIRPAKTNGGKK